MGGKLNLAQSYLLCNNCAMHERQPQRAYRRSRGETSPKGAVIGMEGGEAYEFSRLENVVAAGS